MLIGYARVSTGEQNLDLQLDALNKAGCEQIITDKISSTKDKRPGFDKLWEILRANDTLVIWRLDRLCASLVQLLQTIEKLKERKIYLHSLNESIDTTTPAGQLMLQVFGAMNEFRINVIQQNTRVGLAAARARGKMGGRKHKLDAEQQQRLRELYESKTISIKEICILLGISNKTLYNYLNDQQKGAK